MLKKCCFERNKLELQHFEIRVWFDLIKVRCFFCYIKKQSETSYLKPVMFC